jgi:acetyltransferase-like isoleucine patch superfamily enzyme
MISKEDKIGKNVRFGHNVVIEDNVVIGDNTFIGHNVVIREGSIIGANCQIWDGTVIGKSPSKAKRSATTVNKKFKPCIIGDYVTIGTLSVIYKGSIIKDSVFIADMASIREDVVIGEETIIGKSVSVENKTTIGKRVKIETQAYITAMSRIEDYVFIAPNVTFTNDNFLGRTEKRFEKFGGPVIKKGARIGAGSVLLPNVVIGQDTLVAAGSVVTKNLEPEKVYMGAPAKYFKDVDEEQLLKNNL